MVLELGTVRNHHRGSINPNCIHALVCILEAGQVMFPHILSIKFHRGLITGRIVIEMENPNCRAGWTIVTTWCNLPNRIKS